ncbi:hypothetical protein RHMOL_Rhmol09G0033400 [Rhododendron molle]|uniref:Uncharacterized protein n=1 Tax=Rhododendron molle TaxID=49168 RepID=A0ACC0MAE5_RHOML|nr:hypothetical protein RHMOL_Rhmol09G0033400 [Rhododendron molle]
MRSEPSDARSDGSIVRNTVLRTPLHNTIPTSVPIFVYHIYLKISNFLCLVGSLRSMS